MSLDTFTRHLGAATVALLAVLFSAAVVWQITHGHDVDPLLASLAGGTIAYLLPSPAQTGRVTVENDPSDPVPTADVDRGESFVWFLLIVAAVCAGVVLGHLIYRAL